MRIGFFVQDEGIHWDCARYLIESVRRTMPAVEVFQLTNDSCPVVPGSQAIRIPGLMPMGLRRIQHYSQLEGEWCFCDTDVLFMEDVRDVFGANFDVAVSSRDGSGLEGSKYAKDFPYNFGVVFSRSPEFWKTALKAMKMLPPAMQEWEGEQWVTGKMVNSGRFPVKVLPRAYNFTPEGGDYAGAKILHMKGPRKKLIPQIMGEP